jgi:hypothetical protein
LESGRNSMGERRKLAKKPVDDQYTGTVLAGVANNGLLWPRETKNQDQDQR